MLLTLTRNSSVSVYMPDPSRIPCLSIDYGTPDGLIFSNSLSGLDSMRLIVSGNEYTMNIYALFCNLGKGASGAAIQNMNIAIGASPVKGLKL